MAASGLAVAVLEAIARAPGADEAVRVAVRTIHDASNRYDWTGVYLVDPGGDLVLAHYQGAPTPHTRIGVDTGICGAAVRERATIVVPDVQSDPRYLSCHIETKSEIVVPIMKGGRVYGEIDVDSHSPDAFVEADRRDLERIAEALAERLAAATGQGGTA
jgi:GAF domain-containing protein